MCYTQTVKRQTTKEIVVAALITDVEGKILIVKPSHKEGWIFPGGYVEIGESPSEAFKREIMAELGIEPLGSARLLCVDYRGDSDEYVMFIFDGGTLSRDMIDRITIPPSLLDWKFVTIEEAGSFLRTNSAKRLKPALEARTRTGIAYLEHQEPL